MDIPSILLVASFITGIHTAPQGGCGPKSCDDHALVTTISDKTLLRGFFISPNEEITSKRRREAIYISRDITLGGTSMANTYFSKHSEVHSTSQDFVETSKKFGTSVAVQADANYLFLKVKAGHSQESNTEHIEEHGKTSDINYYQAIEGSHIPIKSIVLDPKYMRLNQEVLNALRLIENDDNPAKNQKEQFINLFNDYGTHFLTGIMQVGGTVISSSKTYHKHTTLDNTLKTQVNEATKSFLDAHATFSRAGGGTIVVISTDNLKSNLKKNINHEIRENVTLNIITLGGPPYINDIIKWKDGLLEQKHTWAIIDKSINLIPIWELLTLHHTNEFQHASRMAHQMKEAWESSLEFSSSFDPSDYEYYDEEEHVNESMKKLVEEFNALDISKHVEGRTLIRLMLVQGKLGAKKDSRYARIEHTNGHLAMSVLQKEPLPKDTALLEFDKVMYFHSDPYIVYLLLKHGTTHLGYINIELDGYKEYPKYVNQVVALATGLYSNGSYINSPFKEKIRCRGGENSGENIQLYGYVNDNNELDWSSLFPVEEAPADGKGVHGTDVIASQVYARGSVTNFQMSGLRFRNYDHPGYTLRMPLLGRVTQGLEILREIASNVGGGNYLKEVRVRDSGILLSNY